MTTNSDTVTVTMPRTAAMHLLRGMMADACEDYMCSSWLIGWEDTFPPIVRAIAAGVEAPTGWLGETTRPEAQLMCAFADSLGHWVSPSYGDRPPYLLPHVPLSERQEV